MLHLAIIIIGKFFSWKKRTMLVLFQNNNELRATGGFITNVIEVEIGRFQIHKKSVDIFEDIKTTSNEEVPEAMKRLLKVGALHFRDANYSPDFNTSAQRLIQMYEQAFANKHIDSIVAINFTLLEKILHITGPVTNNHETWNEKNAFYKLSTRVSNIDLHNRGTLKHRKSILSSLMETIMFKMATNIEKWNKLWQCMNKSLSTKGIQFYMKGKNLASTFTRKHAKDFLAVIDNNYLGIKSNRYIKRHINHRVVFSGDTKAKKLGEAKIANTITLEHFGTYDYPLSGTYQSHMEIYLPSDAENIHLADKHTTKTDDEFIILGVDNLIRPGEKKIIEIEYTIAAKIIDNEYSFRFIKQSGVTKETISEIVQLPKYMFAQTKNNDLDVREHLAFYEKSSEDHEYTIEGKIKTDGPRIYWHEIVGPQLIEVRFNEPVFFQNTQKTAELKDKETGKEITIKSMELVNNGTYLRIKTENLPTTPEKFYTLRLPALKNEIDISLQPEPRIITVVYRPKRFIET